MNATPIMDARVLRAIICGRSPPGVSNQDRALVLYGWYNQGGDLERCATRRWLRELLAKDVPASHMKPDCDDDLSEELLACEKATIPRPGPAVPRIAYDECAAKMVEGLWNLWFHSADLPITQAGMKATFESIRLVINLRPPGLSITEDRLTLRMVVLCCLLADDDCELKRLKDMRDQAFSLIKDPAITLLVKHFDVSPLYHPFMPSPAASEDEDDTSDSEDENEDGGKDELFTIRHIPDCALTFYETNVVLGLDKSWPGYRQLEAVMSESEAGDWWLFDPRGSPSHGRFSDEYMEVEGLENYVDVDQLLALLPFVDQFFQGGSNTWRDQWKQDIRLLAARVSSSKRPLDELRAVGRYILDPPRLRVYVAKTTSAASRKTSEWVEFVYGAVADETQHKTWASDLKQAWVERNDEDSSYEFDETDASENDPQIPCEFIAVLLRHRPKDQAIDFDSQSSKIAILAYSILLTVERCRRRLTELKEDGKYHYTCDVRELTLYKPASRLAADQALESGETMICGLPLSWYRLNGYNSSHDAATSISLATSEDQLERYTSNAVLSARIKQYSNDHQERKRDSGETPDVAESNAWAAYVIIENDVAGTLAHREPGRLVVRPPRTGLSTLEHQQYIPVIKRALTKVHTEAEQLANTPVPQLFEPIRPYESPFPKIEPPQFDRIMRINLSTFHDRPLARWAFLCRNARMKGFQIKSRFLQGSHDAFMDLVQYTYGEVCSSGIGAGIENLIFSGRHVLRWACTDSAHRYQCAFPSLPDLVSPSIPSLELGVYQGQYPDRATRSTSIEEAEFRYNGPLMTEMAAYSTASIAAATRQEATFAGQNLPSNDKVLQEQLSGNFETTYSGDKAYRPGTWEIYETHAERLACLMETWYTSYSRDIDSDMALLLARQIRAVFQLRPYRPIKDDRFGIRLLSWTVSILRMHQDLVEAAFCSARLDVQTLVEHIRDHFLDSRNVSQRLQAPRHLLAAIDGQVTELFHNLVAPAESSFNLGGSSDPWEALAHDPSRPGLINQLMRLPSAVRTKYLRRSGLGLIRHHTTALDHHGLLKRVASRTSLPIKGIQYSWLDHHFFLLARNRRIEDPQKADTVEGWVETLLSDDRSRYNMPIAPMRDLLSTFDFSGCLHEILNESESPAEEYTAEQISKAIELGLRDEGRYGFRNAISPFVDDDEPTNDSVFDLDDFILTQLRGRDESDDRAPPVGGLLVELWGEENMEHLLAESATDQTLYAALQSAISSPGFYHDEGFLQAIEGLSVEATWCMMRSELSATLMRNSSSASDEATTLKCNGKIADDTATNRSLAQQCRAALVRPFQLLRTLLETARRDQTETLESFERLRINSDEGRSPDNDLRYTQALLNYVGFRGEEYRTSPAYKCEIDSMLEVAAAGNVPDGMCGSGGSLVE